MLSYATTSIEPVHSGKPNSKHRNSPPLPSQFQIWLGKIGAAESKRIVTLWLPPELIVQYELSR